MGDWTLRVLGFPQIWKHVFDWWIKEWAYISTEKIRIFLTVFQQSRQIVNEEEI